MRTLLLTLFSAFCIMAQGKKITDESIKNFCRDANHVIMAAATESDKQSAFEAEAAKWSKVNDLDQITSQQVDLLFESGGMALDKYIRRWLQPVFAAKAGKDATFAFYAWKYMPENDGFMHSDKEIEALMLFLASNDLQSQIDGNAKVADEIFASLATMKDANWHTQGFPEAIIRFLECRMPELAVLECVKSFNSIARVDSISADYREAIRKACIAKYRDLEKSLDNPRKQKMCQENIKYLEGPFAKGTLVGNPAPEMNFLRVFKQNGDSVEVRDIKTLADFKGKVVMIDFWGTKCVPCIQSFPEVAELQKHFEGKDVVILGVTSLQGYFVDTPNHRTVQCRNNPEKELGCFPAYMKGMGINWHIGVSQQDVMNTDFGVLAIPHITILDREGNVCYNALNADNETKIDIIETLLNKQ